MTTGNPLDLEALTVERFEAERFPPGDFTHEAHVFMGWQYTQAFGAAAPQRFDAALRRFVRERGAESKYNAMITWLFMKLIAERARDGEGWAGFRLNNRDLFDERPPSGA